MKTSKISQELINRINALTNRTADSEIRDCMQELLTIELGADWDTINYWQVAEALGGWRGKMPSKTTQVENVRAKYHTILAQEEATAQAQSDAMFVAQNEELLEEYLKSLVSLQNTRKETLVKLNTTVSSQCAFEHLTVWVSEGRVVFKNAEGHDVDCYYHKSWGEDEPRTLKVQTSSYGSITPDSPQATMILLQAHLLTDTYLRQAIIDSILQWEEFSEGFVAAIEANEVKFDNIPKTVRTAIRKQLK